MKRNQVSLIICPPHLLDKWRRELHSLYPDMVFQSCRRHEEIRAFMEASDSGEKLLGFLSPQIQSLFISCKTILRLTRLFEFVLLAEAIAQTPKIMLIKRDMAKLGCKHRPAFVWKRIDTRHWGYQEQKPANLDDGPRIISRRVPSCATCGAIAVAANKGKGEREEQPILSEAALARSKHSCQNCHSPLWQEDRQESEKAKAGEKFASVNPRYRLDKYLAKVYRKRIYLLLWDEAHEAQYADRGNGEAFARLASISSKILVGTGTPFNGKSSSIYNLEYQLNDRVRQEYPLGGSARLSRKIRGYKEIKNGKLSYFSQALQDSEFNRGQSESRWVRDMGIRERVIDEYPEYDKKTGVFTGTASYQRPYVESNGINPRLVAQMLDHSIYLSLQDLGIALPDYQEIPMPVQMEEDIAESYRQTEKTLLDYLKTRRLKGDMSFHAAYMEWARGWPNRPDQDCEVIHNIRVDDEKESKTRSVIASIPAFDKQRIFRKEAVLLELLKAELKENRPCIIYLRQTITNDIRPRLETLIREQIEGARPYSLPSSLDAEKREGRINEALKEGMNILITAPQLVSTGLDLIDFKTIIWYETTYDLRVFSQASSRTLRANSDPKIGLKTYYLFYQDSMEQRAFQIMSRKHRAAKLLTGDIGLSGLDALTSDESNFEESLVNTLLNGSEALTDPSQSLNQEVEPDAILQADLAYWNQTGAVETGSYLLISPWQVLKQYFTKERCLEAESEHTGQSATAAVLEQTEEQKIEGKTTELPAETPVPGLFTEKLKLSDSSIRVERFLRPRQAETKASVSGQTPEERLTKTLASLKASVQTIPRDPIFAGTDTAARPKLERDSALLALLEKLKASQCRLDSRPVFRNTVLKEERGGESLQRLIRVLQSSIQRLPEQPLPWRYTS